MFQCRSPFTDAITTPSEAERRFKLSRTEDEAFFIEWQTRLPNLSSIEQAGLDELRWRYLYQRSEGQLLEGTVTLLLASPLLAESVHGDTDTFPILSSACPLGATAQY